MIKKKLDIKLMAKVFGYNFAWEMQKFIRIFSQKVRFLKNIWREIGKVKSI